MKIPRLDRSSISRDLLAELIAEHLGVVNVSLVWEVDGSEFKGATIIATVGGPAAAIPANDLALAVQAAARDLPEGWEIQINVEKGAGWVTGGKTNGESYMDFERGGMTLSEQVAECVKIAKRGG